MPHYKILHTPTGLFFHPTRRYSHSDFEKGHLSSGGKVYMHKPSWNYVYSGLSQYQKKKYPKTDFVIIEFEVIERERINF